MDHKTEVIVARIAWTAMDKKHEKPSCQSNKCTQPKKNHNKTNQKTSCSEQPPLKKGKKISCDFHKLQDQKKKQAVLNLK